MKKFTTRSIAGLCVAAGSLTVAVPAQAANTIGLFCSDSVDTPNNPGYVDCAGPKDGVFDGSQSLNDLQSFFSLPFVFKGYSSDPNGGPFQNDPKTSLGTLFFDQTLFGYFVVALEGEASSNYSYYLFDVGAIGAASLLYDTKGVTNSVGDAASPSLSFAGLYVQPGPQGGTVPEPTGLALIAAACGALALTTRRRR